MRVLFLSTPQVSHVFPMVPTAWALRAAGHDVVLATSGTAARAAERTGIPVVDLAPGDAEHAEAIPRLIAGHPAILWARLTRTEDGWPMLAGAVREFADSMTAAAEAVAPDLVVHSQLLGAGAVAAAKIGVPSVDHGFGLLRTGAFHDHLPGLVPEVFERHGLSGLDGRRVVVDVAPPSLVEPHEGAWPMRFVPYNGGGSLPPWLSEPPSRPRVVVTVGAVGLGPDADLFLSRVQAAASGVDAEFLVLGAGDRPNRDNVRFAQGWVPLRELLDTSAAIVHHGGGGTMLSAFDAGVPQLSVPVAAPNYLQSVALQERGAGFWTELDGIDAAAFDRLLGDDKLRAAAREVRDELRAMPTPHSLVPRLEELVG
jgi:UDP:flavonoid glycosyltransferase YjiC (YdhE family)